MLALMSSGVDFSGLLVICLITALLMLVGCAGLITWLFFRKQKKASNTREAPRPQRSSQRIFFLRFEGQEDEEYVQQIVNRYTHISSALEIREAALELVRVANTATHAWAGEAFERRTVVRCGLQGGIIVGFLARSSTPFAVPHDSENLESIVSELKTISNWTRPQFAGGELIVAQTTHEMSAPVLRAIRKETRPGHQLCGFCDHSFLISEMSCTNCGAPIAQNINSS